MDREQHHATQATGTKYPRIEFLLHFPISMTLSSVQIRQDDPDPAIGAASIVREGSRCDPIVKT
jgi:hypothetical protein